MLAWIRRIIVSLGIGGASYLIMLAFMILSVVYDKERSRSSRSLSKLDGG
jgi:hypothetical protein